MECWRGMGGGGGHLMGAPTNQKDGLWGQWWAKLPWVLEWQGWTGGSKCGAIWLGWGGGRLPGGNVARGRLGGGVGLPMTSPPPQKQAPFAPFQTAHPPP